MARTPARITPAARRRPSLGGGVIAPPGGSPAAAVLAALTADPGGAAVAGIAGHAQISVAAARKALLAHEKPAPPPGSRAPGPASPTPGSPPPGQTRSPAASLAPPAPPRTTRPRARTTLRNPPAPSDTDTLWLLPWTVAAAPTCSAQVTDTRYARQFGCDTGSRPTCRYGLSARLPPKVKLACG